MRGPGCWGLHGAWLRPHHAGGMLRVHHVSDGPGTSLPNRSAGSFGRVARARLRDLPSGHKFSICHEISVRVRSIDAGGSDGVLSTPYVVPQHAWKQYDCCRGSAVLACRPPMSEKSCLREWRAALSAAHEICSGVVFKTSVQAKLDLHDCSRLHVQHSGWADCNGIYRRSGILHSASER